MKRDFLQLLYEMVNDIKRYPLPICFDPDEEQSALYRRQLRLERIAQRFLSIMSIREQNVQASVARDDDSSTSADLQKTLTDNFTDADGRGLPKSYSELKEEIKELEYDCESWENSAILSDAKVDGLLLLLKEKEDEIRELKAQIIKLTSNVKGTDQ